MAVDPNHAAAVIGDLFPQAPAQEPPATPQGEGQPAASAQGQQPPPTQPEPNVGIHAMYEQVSRNALNPQAEAADFETKMAEIDARVERREITPDQGKNEHRALVRSMGQQLGMVLKSDTM